VSVEALDGPGGSVRGTVLSRANPVAKLVVALAVSAALLLTVDVVTAGTALAFEVLVLPWAGLAASALARRSAVVLVGAIPAGVATALFGLDHGGVLFSVGPVTVTTGSAVAGLAISTRVLAIGLPGVVLLATTDPTDLADALAQVLRLPVRFVLSALAAMRLFGVFAREWEDLRLARRARGLGDGGPLGRARTVAGQLFSLLVLALRRATVLSTAMEARGFGLHRERTWARPSRLTGTDLVVMAGGLVLALAATAAGLAAGTWKLLLS
jgi:energy-coupling factor transport system permease protein